MANGFYKTLCLVSFLLSVNGDIEIKGFDETRWIHANRTLPFERKYYYYHGEELHLTCVNLDPGSKYDTLTWTLLFRNETNSLSKVKITKNIRLDALIHNSDMISCRCEPCKNESHIRTQLLWDSKMPDNPDTIIMSGFDKDRWEDVQKTILREPKIVYMYKYHFYHGEILNLVCQRLNTNTFGQLGLYKGSEPILQNITKLEASYKLNPSDHGIDIACKYETKSKNNTNTIQMIRTEMLWNTYDSRNVGSVGAYNGSTYKCRSCKYYWSGTWCLIADFFLTGLPPAMNLKWDIDYGGDCSTVLNYTETPYELNLSCGFAAKGDTEQAKIARIGYKELSLSIEESSPHIKYINIEEDAVVNATFSLNPKDNGKKITCLLMKEVLDAAIFIKLNYVPPPTTTSSNNKSLTKFNRHKRKADSKDQLEMDVVKIMLSLKNNVFTCETKTENVSWTEGSQGVVTVSHTKDIYEFICAINNKTIDLLREIAKNDITESLNVTKSMAGRWNCSALAYKTKGKMFSKMRPQYQRGDFTYLKATCIINIEVLDRPTPSTTTSTTPIPSTTTTKKPATISTISTKTSVKKNEKIENVKDNSSNKTESNHTKAKNKPKPNSTKNKVSEGDKSNKGSSNDKKIINVKDNTSNKTESNKSITNAQNKPKPNSTENNNIKGDKSKKGSSGDKQSKTKEISTTTKSTPMTTNINIVLSEKLKAPPTTLPPITTTTSTTTTTTTNTAADDDAKEDFAGASNKYLGDSRVSINKNYIYYGIAAVAVIIVFIIVIVVSYRTCKQVKEQQRRERNEYENLQDENVGQFPPNLENAYSLPYDSLRRPTDDSSEISPYAIANYQNNAPTDTYSVPYVENDLSKLYSKPLPKSQRKELMYSKVLPKSKRKQESPYAEIQPKEIAYAEIEAVMSGRNKLKPVESAYSEVMTGYTNVNDKTNDYNNVVPQNSRYCNAKDTEYAEPAYCELMKDDKKMINKRK